MGPLGQEIRSTQVFPADTGRDSGPVGGSGTPLSQRRTLLFPGRPQEMKCVERDGMGWDGTARLLPPSQAFVSRARIGTRRFSDQGTQTRAWAFSDGP